MNVVEAALSKKHLSQLLPWFKIGCGLAEVLTEMLNWIEYSNSDQNHAHYSHDWYHINRDVTHLFHSMTFSNSVFNNSICSRCPKNMTCNLGKMWIGLNKLRIIFLIKAKRSGKPGIVDWKMWNFALIDIFFSINKQIKVKTHYQQKLIIIDIHL